MATEPISGLNGGVALTAPASGDKMPVTDVSDTTEAASGTTKPISLIDLLKIVFGSFALSGDISPAQITSNQNDYNPTDLATSSVLRLSTDASRNLTSIAGGSDGRVLLILNIGSNNLVLKDDDGATGTAANRFALSGDVTLAGDQGAIIWYDSTSSRWRIFATSAALGGSPTGSAGGDLSGTYPNPTAIKTSLTAAHGSDDTWTGTTISGLNAGATIAQWEVVYLDGSSTWQLGDANGSGTYPARGLATAAYSSTNPAVILVHGTVRNDAWNWTPGGTIYLSATAGGLTQTAPSTSGDKVQQVGLALTADIAFFDFNSTYLTVT